MEKTDQQKQAVEILNEHVRRGTLLRPGTCDLCGNSNCEIVGHHWRGYDFPLDVWWICPRCSNLLKGKHDGSMTKEQARDYVSGGRFALRAGIDHAQISEAAKLVSHAAKAKNTRRAYKFAWENFTDWCRRFNCTPMPASIATLAEYIRIIAEVDKVSTIQVKLAAISFAHQAAHQPDPIKTPEIRTLMSGLRRLRGTAPDQKAPITRDMLEQMISSLPDSLAGQRDKALLLIGFTGAFRRSELVALDVVHVAFLPDRAVITLVRSKTDQEGRGRKKHIPKMENRLCPVAALQAWLAAAQITSGPLFRKVDRWGKVSERRLNDRTVARIVKNAAWRAGINPVAFSGHSLRSGFITSAAGRGVDEWKIQEVSQHKSAEVLRGYIRDAGQGGLEAIRRVMDG